MSIKRLLIMAILIAPFVYAYREKPLLDDHKTMIYQLAADTGETVSEEQLALPIWDGLEYIDWVIVTCTRDKTNLSLVSIGIVKYIKLVDDDWGPIALGLKKDEKKNLP